MEENFFGYGLTRPFRRGAKDFANAGGADLVATVVAQVLGTRAASATTQGELPWRPNAGSLLHVLRHRNNTATSRERARIYVQDAIRRWEPRVEVLDVTVPEPQRINELNQMVVRVTWRLIGKNVPGNEVLLPPRTTEVRV